MKHSMISSVLRKCWSAPLSRCLALMACLMAAMSMITLPPEVTVAINSAKNATWMTILALVIPATEITRRRPAVRADPLATSLVIGIQYVSLGTLIHQGYWLMASVSAPAGELVRGWFLENKDVLIAPMIAIAWGYMLHARPVLVSIRSDMVRNDSPWWPRWIPWWGLWWIAHGVVFALVFGSVLISR